MKQRISLTAVIDFIIVTAMSVWTLLSLFIPLCSVSGPAAQGTVVTISDTGFSIASFSSLIISDAWAIYVMGALSVIYLAVILFSILASALVFTGKLNDKFNDAGNLRGKLKLICIVMLAISLLYMLSGIIETAVAAHNFRQNIVGTLCWMPILFNLLFFGAFIFIPKVLPGSAFTVSEAVAFDKKIVDEQAIGKLKELKALKDAKALNEEEYETLKAELIKRI